MSSDPQETGWAIHSILHQNKQKYRQLGASLLLTSSFAHHKQKIHLQKREKMENMAANQIVYHQEVLQAKRINGTEDNKNLEQHIDISLSNIDRLKRHARKLMDQEIKKLGKQNEGAQNPQQNRINTAQSQQLSVGSHFRINKKPNKRKIVKGRPDMYTITKKRTFLLNLMDEGQQNLVRNTSDRQIIKQLLNKNNLLKFISTKNQKLEHKNLYDNYERHKTVEEVAKMNREKRLNLRKTSLSLIKPFQNTRQRFRGKASNGFLDVDGQNAKNEIFVAKKRRYLSIRTIQ